MSQSGVRQLRTRPIDVNKKLFIIRGVEDLGKLMEEEHGVRIDASQLGFSCSSSNDCSFSSASSLSSFNLPKPNKVIVVPATKTDETLSYDHSQHFTRPDHYIRFHVHKDLVTGLKLDENTTVHFDMLKQDDEFLDNLNKKASSHKQAISENEFCKMIDRFEKQTGKWVEGKSEIRFDEALKITKDLKMNVKSHIVKEVYNHWKRRRSANNRPLLRQFWPQCSPHDTSAYAVFRPRTRDKMNLRKPRRNNYEILHKMSRLVDDFKKVEKILKKIKQRDEKKLAIAEVSECIFDQMRHELFDSNYKCPHWIYLRESKFDKSNKKSRKDRHNREAFQNSNLKYPSPIVEGKVNRHLRGSFLSSCWSLERFGKENGFDRFAVQRNLLDNLQTECLSKIHAKHYSHIPLRVPFRVVRRVGRGGRIWLDRRHIVLPKQEEVSSSKRTSSTAFGFDHVNRMFESSQSFAFNSVVESGCLSSEEKGDVKSSYFANNRMSSIIGPRCYSYNSYNSNSYNSNSYNSNSYNSNSYNSNSNSYNSNSNSNSYNSNSCNSYNSNSNSYNSNSNSASFDLPSETMAPMDHMHGQIGGKEILSRNDAGTVKALNHNVAAKSLSNIKYEYDPPAVKIESASPYCFYQTALSSSSAFSSLNAQNIISSSVGFNSQPNFFPAVKSMQISAEVTNDNTVHNKSLHSTTESEILDHDDTFRSNLCYNHKNFDSMEPSFANFLELDNFLNSTGFHLFGIQSYSRDQRHRLEMLEALNIGESSDDVKQVKNNSQANNWMANMGSEKSGILNSNFIPNNNVNGSASSRIERESATAGGADVNEENALNEKKKNEKDRALFLNFRCWIKHCFPSGPRIERQIHSSLASSSVTSSFSSSFSSSSSTLPPSSFSSVKINMQNSMDSIHLTPAPYFDVQSAHHVIRPNQA